ncbi:hypothetical protein U1Q18_050730 [Sarracenia purpurea var. burkii]
MDEKREKSEEKGYQTSKFPVSWQKTTTSRRWSSFFFRFSSCSVISEFRRGNPYRQQFTGTATVRSVEVFAALKTIRRDNRGDRDTESDTKARLSSSFVIVTNDGVDDATRRGASSFDLERAGDWRRNTNRSDDNTESESSVVLPTRFRGRTETDRLGAGTRSGWVV